MNIPKTKHVVVAVKTAEATSRRTNEPLIARSVIVLTTIANIDTTVAATIACT